MERYSEQSIDAYETVGLNLRENTRYTSIGDEFIHMGTSMYEVELSQQDIDKAAKRAKNVGILAIKKTLEYIENGSGGILLLAEAQKGSSGKFRGDEFDTQLLGNPKALNLLYTAFGVDERSSHLPNTIRWIAENEDLGITFARTEASAGYGIIKTRLFVDKY